jgi:hypothetical protein
MSILLGRTGSISDQGDVRLYDANGLPLVFAQGAKPSNPSGLIAGSLNDGVVRHNRSDRMGNILIGNHQPRFSTSFEGTVLNPTRWLTTSVTYTAAQTDATGLQLNNANSLTAAAGYLLQSTQRLLRMQRAPLQVRFRARCNWTGANTVMRMGLGDSSAATGDPSNAAVFEVTPAGFVQGALYTNGTAALTTPLSSIGAGLLQLDPAAFYTFDVIVDDDSVRFVIQRTSDETILADSVIQLPNGAARLFAVSSLPIQIQQLSTAAPTTASSLFIADVYCSQLDQNTLNSDVYSQFGLDSLFNPNTGAAIQNWANNAAPTVATLSNTAAGYATLGGRFLFAAPAGAATDFALFGFQIPAGRNYRLRSVTVDVYNLGAAVATTPTLLEWFVATQLTAISLATAAHGRTGIGVQSFPVGAPVGAVAGQIRMQYATPVKCDSGRFIVFGVRVPVGTATASQQLQGTVVPDGEFY